MERSSALPHRKLALTRKALADCGLLLITGSALVCASQLAWAQSTPRAAQEWTTEPRQDATGLQLVSAGLLNASTTSARYLRIEGEVEQRAVPEEQISPSSETSVQAGLNTDDQLVQAGDEAVLRLRLSIELSSRSETDQTTTAMTESGSSEGHVAPAPLLAPPPPASRLPVVGTSAITSLPPEAMDMNGGLRLRYLLDVALAANPNVQAARLDMRASTQDQLVAERQRWPTLSAVLESQSGNETQGATKVMRVEQTLWDAGRMSARISEATTIVNINQTRINLTSQQLSLQIVNAWQSLLSADGRIAVAQETLEQLNRYRGQMERRVQAEASPPIDLELVLSRTLQTEVELNQAHTNRALALSKLEQLTGIEGLGRLAWRAPAQADVSYTEVQARQLAEVNWLDIARRHPSVEKGRQEVLAARQRIEAKRAEQYPQVYFRMDQPVDSRNNSIASFVGLRYTPGAGLSTAVEAQALATRAESLEQAVEAAVREVTETLFADRDDFHSARSRMQALDKAVQGSRTVLDSYSRQFPAGRKSWLDLMNAVREMAQNRYALAETQAAMFAALYRLQVRMGEPVQPAF